MSGTNGINFFKFNLEQLKKSENNSKSSSISSEQTTKSNEMSMDGSIINNNKQSNQSNDTRNSNGSTNASFEGKSYTDISKLKNLQDVQAARRELNADIAKCTNPDDKKTALGYLAR